ncbi:RluA family pseudouridine synthase [Buchnera aphidicola (Pseudoregma panicola)]|uniref:RluA family pseudouridine synthase n=1 Tax=Buchnera aphidicola TaxID=9 RepID=UPI0031B728B2
MKKIKKKYTNVKKILIEKNSIGQRIDNFIKKKFKKISKNAIYTMIRKGRIRINKKRAKAKNKLKKNDIIRIPPIYKINKNKKKNICIKYYAKIIKKRILYEDKYLIIINKPKKIAVHGGSGISFGIIEIMRFIYTIEKNLELVHRLDKETSGILLISKKKFVLKSLHEQIKNRTTKKTYIAAIHGSWPKKIKTIKFPLLKTKNIFGKRLVIVNKNGKVSETKFKIKKKYKNITILKIILITGRTHQIRVHTSQIGYPIVNDNRYGNRNLDKKININNKNLCLHACKFSFVHPKTKEKINITSNEKIIL